MLTNFRLQDPGCKFKISRGMGFCFLDQLIKPGLDAPHFKLLAILPDNLFVVHVC